MSFEVGSDLDFPDLGKDAGKALDDIMEFLLDESNKVVPIEEGTLLRSGLVDREGLQGTISYDTPYAVKQHEDKTLKHDPGRSAKYLERTIKNKGKIAMKYLEKELKGLF